MEKGKWLRRLGAGLLAGALLLGTAGCGGEAGNGVRLDPQNPVAIEVWHYYNGPLKKAFDSMVTEFNETVGQEMGIVVDAFNPGDVSQLTQKVIDAAEKKVGSSEIPDIFAAYPDTAYQLDQMGLVADLGDYLTEEEQAEFVPGYLAEGRAGKDGALIIFPVAKATELFMLNKTDWDKFADATGARESELSTIEGLTRTAKAYYEWTDSLTPAPDDGKALFGRDAMANYFLIGAKQLGVELFDVQGGEVTFRTDEDVLRKLWDNFYVPFVNGWFGAYGRFRSDDAKTGDIIALVGSSSGVSYFPDQVVVGDSDGYPIESLTLAPPCFDGAAKVAVQQGAGMVVTKSAPAKEYASCVFLKWFTEPERNIRFALESGYLPVKKAANDMEAIHAVVDGDAELELPEKIEASLPVAIQTVGEYEMYAPRAFQGGTAARGVLESSLFELAKADAEAVQALVEGGAGRAEAAGGFTTDEHFREWAASLRSQLEQAIG